MARLSRFQRSARKQTGRARRAFRENGPGHKLMDSLGSSAYLFRLETSDLDPSISSDPSGLYSAAVVSRLANAAAKLFQGPFLLTLEVGRGDFRAPGRGRLHAHLIGHRDDGPGPQHIRRDTERCKAVYDVLGAYRYLAKCPEPYSLEAELDATVALVLSPSGRLPNTRRHFLSLERLAWAAAAPYPKNQTQPPAPDIAPAEAAPQLPDPAPPPQLPASVGLRGRPQQRRPHSAPRRLSRPLDPSPSELLRVIGNGYPSVATAPPSRSAAAAGPASYPVRQRHHRRPPRSREPP